MSMHVATCAAEPIESGNDLGRLLDLLASVQEPVPCEEDIAVWCGGQVVVVRHADGSLTWINPKCRRLPPAAVATAAALIA
jgi:hypothetical protein